MKISMICFGLTGQETGERLARGLREHGREVLLSGKSRYLENSISESVGAWTGRQFLCADGIVFIGACGIAVRSIAPYVAGKKTDPAVVVVDECGKFAVSLLSGHLGGANELAQEIAGILGAQPVVTTATDLHGRFAVDVFAKKNDCAIFHMKAAKEVSAALLAGEPVGFWSPWPFEGRLPEGLVLCTEDGEPTERAQREEALGAQDPSGADAGWEKPKVGIAVTIRKDRLPFASTVQVVPRAAALGLGCRKNKAFEEIQTAAKKNLEDLGIYREALFCLASISLKKEEPGILALRDKWSLPFVTYTEEELRAAKGEFTASSFVRQVTGVDNVCERSAVLASGGGRLIQKKIGGGGVTFALAVRDWRIRFE